MMIFPKMFADSNRITTQLIKKHLKEYNHLIKWRNQPSVLEIGYGDGGSSQKSFFPHLPKDLKEFVALDKSEKMVEYARKNSILPTMKIEQLDITTKQLPSQYINRFDHIFGFFLMHMVKDPKQAFMNMHKMLKQGGSIFQTFFERTPIDNTLEKLLKNPEWNTYGVEDLLSPYNSSPDPRQEWERNLKETGFQNYNFFEDSGSFQYHDSNEFDNLMLSVCTFLPNIPEEKQEDFKKYYRKLTRTGKLIDVQVVDGKEIISINYKLFITSAWRS
ncbi:juvenile hormone acid O-methyltransferase isoform X1 [Leptinotarsa decemlineata]|uniref:juvenile hormone acid O-methyltransferase isoform X1 n=1 Tax=Leptinotarsa decemlineata TaxID=7539 RepID=UPI003D3074D9